MNEIILHTKAALAVASNHCWEAGSDYKVKVMSDGSVVFMTQNCQVEMALENSSDVGNHDYFTRI